MTKERQPMNNRFFWILEIIQQKFTKKNYMHTNLLLTENRKDIEYRVFFLNDVLEKGIPYAQTKYYHFISDVDKGIIREPEISSNSFIQLYEDIKKNGIKEPLVAAKYNSNKIQTRYILKEKKFWKDFENKTGYQLMEGAHRLAIAKYLNYDKIPVKIIKPLSFEIPNYTDYIKIKEKEYLER